MNPKEIISKHIVAIEGMRIPYARMIVENILRDLEDEGYHVVDGTTHHQEVNAMKK